ncbi:helicase-associated domain-containing protein [Actinomycetospora sp. Odt1-22]|uniref:Helicase-associated domain-containing protein n=1 Tax=Actinomycetospora termitidis TaxID=3053470 RepID=A0ABT7MIA1_9PSEU|nr:helicase-associated domain-containing protein [Actinomycetospora sp. Odt1-22]MDL5160181.1 helicase-associated domain-containing protein [Actinomycetospora sp. Odt1-22]
MLTEAADVETRGAATVYRFSSRSVRHALDQGWTAEGLLAGLRALAPDVPQPLDYLVHDAARVHGSVRVHEVRTCVVAEEPLATELAAARALRKLGWRRITPTVLGSGQTPATVLAMLRDAGYSPVLDDGSGAVSVERAAVEPVDAFEPITTPGLQPAEVVRRLREGPTGAEHPTSHTLAQLSGRLTPDELDLLAHSLDRHEPVHITYRVNSGSVTERAITPERLYGPWITAWCHLRNDRRDFTVSSILAVTPA